MRILPVILFNTLFYLALTLGMILILPLFIFSRRLVGLALKGLIYVTIALQFLFGLRVVFRGKENIPKGGCLVASKHQSMWETFMLSPLFYDPGYVYKRELEKIPLFGAYLRKFDMVPIDRDGRASALRDMTRITARKLGEGRQIIIFPEGTRREPGAPPDYKTGIALLYAAANVPVVPVALNSGVYWSKYLWRGKPGRLVVDILPPIPPGLPRDEFMARLQTQLEAAADKLFEGKN